MLLNKVIVGRGYKLQSGNSALTAPPAGYDSVRLLSTSLQYASNLRLVTKILVEIGAGQDELVVFSDDAIRPYYLVIYEP